MTSIAGSHLDAAFRATTYRIETETGCYDVRIGQRHPVLDALLVSRGADRWAIVTASNPGGQRCPAAINTRARLRLLARAEALGFAHCPASNHADDGQWPVECGVLLIGTTEDESLRLAGEFGQLACIVGETGSVARLVWVGKQCASMNI